MFKYILFISLLSVSYAQMFGDIVIENKDCKEVCAQTCNRTKPKNDVETICLDFGKDVKCFNDNIKTIECLNKNINNIILCSNVEGFYDLNGC